ncbi:hypothetical protein C8R44DRAFT_744459 [Mycena epipterygia]|nr:hypothetical protein C8R44DRAFT_744459 [Mycena epipterygia]
MIETEGSASEQFKRKTRSHKPSGISQRGILHKKTKENQQSSSGSRKVNIDSFKRESSEIPEGGWFHATTTASSSDLSPSSSESSESSNSSVDRKKYKSRRQWGYAHSVKIKTRFTFDGRADLDLFDHWTYEIGFS